MGPHPQSQGPSTGFVEQDLLQCDDSRDLVAQKQHRTASFLIEDSPAQLIRMAGCPEKAQVTNSEKSEGRKAMGALGRTGGKEDRGIPDKIRFRPEKKNALPVLMQPSSTTSRSLNNRENREATIFPIKREGDSTDCGRSYSTSPVTLGFDNVFC
jgi:hypothetical protein